MTTTTVIAEIIVIGFFAFTWLLLIILGILSIPFNEVVQFFSNSKDWASGIIIVLVILFYQIGWLVSSLTFGILDLTIGKKLRKHIFQKEKLEYEYVRASFYQKASTELRNDLGVDRSIVRLSRAGFFNFLIIAVCLFIYVDVSYKLALISILFSIGCFIQWYVRYKRYYRRMLTAFLILEKDTSV